MPYRSYTDKDLVNAVESSKSIRQVLFKLNLKQAGGNYKTVHAKIKKLNLSLEHFHFQAHNKGKKLPPKRPITDYFSNKQTIQSYKFKQRLIREKYFEHKCYSCNLTEWLSEPIPLELEHKDGNHLNNSLENLTLLCPNCHAKTSTYRGKNRKDRCEGI